MIRKISNKINYAVISFAFLFFPIITKAAGLVPCGNSENPDPCTLCHFIVGIKNIIDWGMRVLVFVALGAIVLGGIFYIISTGNEEMMKKAKTIIFQTLTGFAIVLGAWLIVTYSMYIIGASTEDGVLKSGNNWYEFTCDTTSTATTGLPGVPGVPGVPGAPVIPSGTPSEMAQQILSSSNINLMSSGDCKDASGAVVSPKRNIQDMATSGSTIACNNSCKTLDTPCTTAVTLSDSLLQTIINAGNSQGFTVISIAGGEHESGSRHYSGRAIDVSPHTQSMVNLLTDSGASNAFCDLSGNTVSCSVASHVHASF